MTLYYVHLFVKTDTTQHMYGEDLNH